MNAPNTSGWKPTTPLAEHRDGATVTGNRALQLEEPLIFELGGEPRTGVDLPKPAGCPAAKACPSSS